ncbi:hypothetical protein F5051DRAFT_462497 [Lentinula edodes]|nr:hypothetical protein F5051DRAFT_462497 [Lentinula edodes]
MIIGVTLWLKPGQSVDLGILDMIRSGGLKALWGWGFMGLKRVFLDFTPAVEQSLKKGFHSRNLDRLDSWHLLEMVVDPEFEGMDIYAHFGFEVDKEHQSGVGSVDENGMRARGEKATGYPEWVMTKVINLG